MTAVGKILVIFNLLFSVGVGALAVVDYSTRTRWAKGFGELEATNKVVTESRNLYKEQADNRGKTLQNLSTELANEVKKDIPDVLRKDDKKGGMDWDEDKVRNVVPEVIKALKIARDRNKSLETEVESQRKLVLVERLKATKAATGTALARATIDVRQKDVDQMRKLLKTETETNTKLIKESNDLRDKAVQAEIERRTAIDRAVELDRAVQDLAKENVRLRAAPGAGGGVATRGTNPPPDNVEGLIKRTDTSGLVTITIGSDSGIAKGHTLEVFRLKPLPKYLGQIRIVSVSHKEAVGQFAGRMTGPLREGDTVAARVQGGN